jgi:hypothetical protein
MTPGALPLLRRSLVLAAAGVLLATLAACTGRGGGYLPPDAAFTGQASFGFSVSCERSSNSTSLNPPAGRLRIQLSYTDHGSSALIGSPFSIHGTVDTIDPALVESMICIGQEPPPGTDPNKLIFLGRYRLTSSAPAKFPTTEECPTRESPATLLCRFEVIVQDNDRNHAPSTGDFFSINLTTVKVLTSELPVGFYTRAGFLAGGNLTVDY